MSSYQYDDFVFTALIDFTQIEDPTERLRKALEFGIRIIEDNGLMRSDWRVVSGPFWRFRCRASSLLTGHDGNNSFFIRRVEVAKNSNVKLYYYDIRTGRDAIVELWRRPGLMLTFRSGMHRSFRLDVNMMCSREKHLCFISNGDRFDVE